VIWPLAGWHVLVILGVLVTIAIVVVAIILAAIRLARKNPRPVTSSPDPVDQLQKLAQLRDEGLLAETEYEAKPAELLGRI
jgi:sugar/nucleoside kinase (ribokinase family)